MNFGPAPVIVPVVLGIAIPFRRAFYVHLALLHVGLALRVAGDLGGDYALAQRSGLLNATAIGVFLAATAATAPRARLRRRVFTSRPDLAANVTAAAGR